MSMISAVIPVRLPAPFLAAALASLTAQDRPLDEILVVAHGWRPSPDDPTFAGIRVVEVSADVDLAGVRNAGLTAANGEYVALLDSDDLALPDRIGRQAAILDAYPEVVLVAGAMDVITTQDTVIGRMFESEEPIIPPAGLLLRNRIGQSAVMMRREAALAVGGYRPLPLAEDYDLWLRLGAIGELHTMHEPVSQYRVHEGQVTSGRHVPRSSWAALWESRRALAKARRIAPSLAFAKHLLWCAAQIR